MMADYMTLHVFNPSHDEALAANSPHYYPSTIARRLAAEWGALPVIWAERGDAVWIPDESAAAEAVTARAAGVRFVKRRDMNRAFWGSVTRITPWGWDLTLRQQLLRAGAPQHLLPTDAEIADIRRLSSRETTTRILPLLRAELERRGVATIGESVVAHTMEAVGQFLQERKEVMVKSLWSCSGRGVFRTTDAPDEPCHRRIARLLREQGGVEMEPCYKAVADFALEFKATADGVRYVGPSLFTTHATGKYAGNIIAPQTEIERRIAAYATGTELFPTLAEACAEILTAHIGGAYTGPLGVDMMWARTDKELRLHPCIEVNLRRTMGHAAIALAERGTLRDDLPPDLRGLFIF